MWKFDSHWIPDTDSTSDSQLESIIRNDIPTPKIDAVVQLTLECKASVAPSREPQLEE